ncbi:hypothetical protein AOR13_2666 [Alteromonas stellipolaris LMG 21856]|nr:hypothetical protein AOR13_2666 [Alteromonas stellipolaris LMG 21856]
MKNKNRQTNVTFAYLNVQFTATLRESAINKPTLRPIRCNPNETGTPNPS